MLPPNPWADVPATPEYVLPTDDAVLRALPASRNELKLHLLPVPFLGDPRRANVVLLGVNPSYHAESDHESADEVGQLRLALTFQSRTPFFNFDPAFRNTYGYRYWSLLLGALIRQFDLEYVGQTVAVVEWCAYRSWKGSSLGPFRTRLLPSQAYGFGLVREAIQREAAIVVLRSLDWWLAVLPELNHASYVEVRNRRRPFISPGNLPPGGFDDLAKRMVGP